MALLGFFFRPPTFARVKSSPPPLPKPQRHFLAPLLGSLLLAVAAEHESAQAQSDSAKEYQIKAAFLFNFAQFVKWPGNCFSGPDAPFCIGVLGDDPFGSALDATIQGETIDNHRLTVIRAQRIEDLKSCQMIFVCRSEESHIGEILSQLDSRPVLTVSEVESFARDGGDISFFLSDGKVHFEINPPSARRCGLKISSQLLTLGKIVEP
jgi:YfiR/HmsC-like